ncbi:MAG TPA: hypothetical protein VIX73_36775, partial [Kofleriaceae bacterium]
ALDAITLDGAATIVVGGGSIARMRARRRGQIAISVIAALIVVVAFGVWSLATSGASRTGSAAAIAPAAPPPRPQITVEPIPMPTPAPSAGSADEIEMLPNDPPRGTARPASPARTVRSAAPSDSLAHRTPRAPRPGQVAPSPTREQLVQKFQQVRREYDDYKAKFGSRLEKEWGDLAMFIQYVREDDAWRVEAARRLDEFRSRMRE